MFATGSVLHDRYTVERVLARGGMATVYVVRHNTLDTQYALKVLDIPTPEIRKRLLQEGRIQASLKHPNIVAVTDAIELDGSPALVMDYVDGPPLSELIDAGPVDPDQAEVWFRQIVSAVSYAHARGLIHRDLKPENVLMAPMTGGYLPKVADFGIAKVVQDYLRGDDGPRTQTGIGMGTPAYMPPEQVQSAGDVDHRADVFALGCILYELMCGERAFPGDNLLSILNAIADGDYTPPWEHRNTLEERIVAAIDGALEPDVHNRIQTCDALLKVLRGDLQRPTKTPPPAGRRQRTRTSPSAQAVPSTSPPRRGWAPWLLGGGAAAMALVVTGTAAVAALVLGGVYWAQTAGTDPAYTDKPSSPMPTAPVPAPVVVEQAEAEPAEPKVLQPAFDVQIRDWTTRPSTADGVMRFAPDGGQVLYVAQAVVTRNPTTHDANTFPWSLVDAAGNTYEAPLRCSMAMADSINPMHTYEPGQTLEGSICFVAPAGLASPEIRFAPTWDEAETLRFPLR